MRRWGLVTGLIAATVLLGSCSAAPPAPKAQPPLDPALGHQPPLAIKVKPSAAHPMRMMLWGDSVLFTIEPSLLKALQSTGAAKAYPQAFPGWGLSTDRQWREHLDAMLAADRPQLVLAMWLWDATWAKEHPKAYDAELEAFIERCLQGPDAAKAVVLLDWPKVGNVDLPMAPDGTYPERDPEGHAAWLASARRVAARHPGRVVVADLTATMLLHGRSAIWLPPATSPKAPAATWLRARHNDAVHVCAEAAARYSTRLLLFLHRVVGLPLPAASWRDRPLTATSNDVLWQAVMAQQQADAQPASADCPADHPPLANNGRTP